MEKEKIKKIKVNFENCYGIKKLEHNFDFEKNIDKKIYLIYAPNGTMKTSFADTLNDYSKNIETKDRIYPNNNTIREIKINNDVDIDRSSIFVIKSYDSEYSSNKVSLLVANKEIKKEYDDSIKDLEGKEKELFANLKKVSKLNKEEVIKELEEILSKDDYYKSLLSLESEINDTNPIKYSNIEYKILFNKYTEELFNDKYFLDNIKKYAEYYNKIIDSSTFFDKTFDHNNADTIADNLEKNGFFKESMEDYRCLSINSNSTKINIKNKKDLKDKINQEKEKILNNDELKTIFNNINIYFNKENTKKFLKYITDKPDIISQLEKPNLFKNKIFVDFLKEDKSIYNKFIEYYKEFIKKNEKIRIEINNTKSKWEEVVEIFNKRFYLPVNVSIKNKCESIFKNVPPMFTFYFNDGSNVRKEVEKDTLIKTLSRGELKALYLLDIIYEIKAREETEEDTIFIIDDIADSFDYKNKYAIVEYLYEIMNTKNFYQIILTHNFDFYRLLSSRLVGTNGKERKNTLEATKDLNNTIILKQMKYQNNPFCDWKKNLDKDNKKLIASICFFRNIADYLDNKENFEILTSMLHIKDNNKKTILDLETVINEMLKPSKEIKLKPDNTKFIKDFIYETIEQEIFTDIVNKIEKIDLEEKIVLAIGIRLKAEEFILSKILNISEEITNNQTFELFRRYKEEFSLEKNNINILSEVNIITPEHIHLNSFMFEPLLDLSIFSLYELYNKVINLK